MYLLDKQGYATQWDMKVDVPAKEDQSHVWKEWDDSGNGRILRRFTGTPAALNISMLFLDFLASSYK